jgi:hypothetical protein
MPCFNSILFAFPKKMYTSATCLIWSILIDNSSTDVLILNPDGGTQLRPVTNSLGQGLQGCGY